MGAKYSPLSLSKEPPMRKSKKLKDSAVCVRRRLRSTAQTRRSPEQEENCCWMQVLRGRTEFEGAMEMSGSQRASKSA
eukprot:3515481-Pleurochrysis_carterae.AAC.1